MAVSSDEENPLNFSLLRGWSDDLRLWSPGSVVHPLMQG